MLCTRSSVYNILILRMYVYLLIGRGLSVARFWPLFAYLSFGRLQKHQTIVFLLVEAVLFLSLASRLLRNPSFRSIQGLDFFDLFFCRTSSSSGRHYEGHTTNVRTAVQHTTQREGTTYYTISSLGYKKNEDDSSKYRTIITVHAVAFVTVLHLLPARRKSIHCRERLVRFRRGASCRR